MAVTRSIPEGIKRQVRQECLFGCVLCGAPVFEYDHIEEFSNVQRHEAHNIALLCPTHHAAKTSKKLSAERVKGARENPYNQGRAHTGQFDVGNARSIKIMLGSTRASTSFPTGEGHYRALWRSGADCLVLHGEGGWLSISMLLTNFDGQPLLAVDNGELMVSTNVYVWDYSYEGSRLTIRQGKGHIVLDMDLANDHLHVHRGAFLDSDRDGFFVDNGAVNILLSGRPTGLIVGGAYEYNGFGAIGMLNTRKFPVDQKPRGFGTCRIF